MTLDQQIDFMRRWRATWAKDSPTAIQMANAILTSLQKLQKFERPRKVPRARAA